jgi:nitrate reductase NapE component
MSSQELPRQQQGPLEFMKWFVIAVTLSPMLCCAGCLGYGFLVARFQRPETGPAPTAAVERGSER